METNKKPSNKFSPESPGAGGSDGAGAPGDHASQWAAIGRLRRRSAARAKRCATGRLAERDAGVRPGATTDEPAIAARPERNNLRQIPGGSDLRARGRQATARR